MTAEQERAAEIVGCLDERQKAALALPCTMIGYEVGKDLVEMRLLNSKDVLGGFGFNWTRLGLAVRDHLKGMEHD